MLRTFIDRPIFATVISIIITLGGALALMGLPIEQYPNVVPPQVVVDGRFPGASADVIADSVVAPLEQEINGVDDMIYLESSATDSGSFRVTVSFEIGTNPGAAGARPFAPARARSGPESGGPFDLHSAGYYPIVS